MKTVNFRFDIDQKVKVEKLGVIGIVAMRTVNDAGSVYYVNSKDGCDWYAERLLADAESE
jgi:hypothetical protein